jgi:hypothetical protein
MQLTLSSKIKLGTRGVITSRSELTGAVTSGKVPHRMIGSKSS